MGTSKACGQPCAGCAVTRPWNEPAPAHSCAPPPPASAAVTSQLSRATPDRVPPPGGPRKLAAAAAPRAAAAIAGAAMLPSWRNTARAMAQPPGASSGSRQRSRRCSGAQLARGDACARARPTQPWVTTRQRQTRAGRKQTLARLTPTSGLLRAAWCSTAR
jgi:hypothetical protein